VTLTDYHGGTPYTSSHSVTVNPMPHPVIHYSGSHTLSVTGAYTSYQWVNGSTPITGATNSTYVTSTSGTYTVVVDSGGCYGYATPFPFSTLQVYPVEPAENTFWLSQPQSGGNAMVFCAQAPDEELRIVVYDEAGRICTSDKWPWNQKKMQLRTSDLPAGFYLVHISGPSASRTLKLVK
jgi:hypothetical protein